MQKQYILLIDDDPDEFDFFLEAINKLPGLFDCSYAVNSTEAVALLDDLSPDYIFVDMNMPLENGLECIQKLKNLGRISKIPVYIYTTGYNEPLKKAAVELGATGCLKKPPHPKLLADVLEVLFKTGDIITKQGKKSVL